MNKELLIITSGSSQFFIQLATLKVNNLNVKEAVVIYNGVYRDSLVDFFKALSKHYGFEYLGEIDFNIQPKPMSVKCFLKGVNFNRLKLDNLIEKNYPLIKEFKHLQTLIISVRVKMFADILLLSYLSPAKVIYTADGVIDVLPKRNFNKWNFNYLRNNLKKFPINDLIHSPFYLKNDIKRIGRFKEIIFDDIIEEIQCLNVVEDFKNKYLQSQVSHIVLSQHYHLHESINFEDDINYYTNLVEFALRQSRSSKVLFKPHPRDLSKKINLIKQINDDRVIVVDDSYKALPIEIFWRYFTKWETVFLTGNSSAPLFFKKYNRIIAVGSNKYLHNQLNNRIKEFAKAHEVEHLMLELS